MRDERYAVEDVLSKQIEELGTAALNAMHNNGMKPNVRVSILFTIDDEDGTEGDNILMCGQISPERCLELLMLVKLRREQAAMDAEAAIKKVTGL